MLHVITSNLSSATYINTIWRWCKITMPSNFLQTQQIACSSASLSRGPSLWYNSNSSRQPRQLQRRVLVCPQASIDRVLEVFAAHARIVIQGEGLPSNFMDSYLQQSFVLEWKTMERQVNMFSGSIATARNGTEVDHGGGCIPIRANPPDRHF